MGTKRRKCLWFRRRDGWFVALPPKWKMSDGGIMFSSQAQLIDFAHGARLVLKEMQGYRGRC